jgi:outer membrane protein assembly factor BamB
MRRRRWVGSAFLIAWALVLVAVLVPVAQAAVAAKASVKPQVQYLNDTKGTTFSFTVKNTSTASESLGSAQISTPSAQWTITACPAAPTEWTAVAAAATCTFDSASGTGDNIPAAGAGTFKVTATTAPGSANVTGLSWTVSVDQDDTYNAGTAVTAHPTKTGALSTTLYAWQVLSAVVSNSTATVGAACPAAHKTAIAGSSPVIVICGKNRANVALTPASGNSSLSGTLIASAGTFSSGSIAAQSSSTVVLSNYSNTTVTPAAGTGKTVVSTIGSNSTQTSPSTTITGYTSVAAWPKFHYDLTNSGYNPNETTIGTSNAPSLVQKWTGVTGGSVASSPAIANGVLYVGSNDGKLYAFDAPGVTGCSGTPTTCAPLWTATTSGSVASSPAVANGVVYVGSSDFKLYAFDAAGVTGCSGTPKTCSPLWTAATSGPIKSSPAVANGVVYVGSDDNELYAFDANGVMNCSGTPKTCLPLWTGPTTGPIDSSPAVSGGVVYIGSLDHGLYAFDANGVMNCSGTPKTCLPLWTGPTNDQLLPSPAVVGGVVYVGSADDKLYAFDAAGVTGCSGTPKTCHRLWTGATANIVRSSPAVADGVVYVGSEDGNFYAFDASGTTGCSGTPKTCSPLVMLAAGALTHTIIESSPAVANGVVYVGSDDDNLYAFGLP